MIIKPGELSQYCQKNLNFFLLYGVNTGLIDDHIENILKPRLSKNIFHYEEQEIIQNTYRFEEDILSKSFFEREKLIIISRGSDRILEIIKNLVEKKIKEVVIIIKTNVLEKRSKLRIFFEKNSNTICVPFYNDSFHSLSLIAKNFFKDNKINISTQNINFILEKTKGNRINLKNELEKIKIFYQSKLTIKFNDIVKLINSIEEHSISDLTDQFLLKNKKKVNKIFNENIQSTENDILILKTLLFKLKRLKKLKNKSKQHKNLDETISLFKPLIFWKEKEIIKNQLNNLSTDEISLLIREINQLELDIKKNPVYSGKILNNFILALW